VLVDDGDEMINDETCSKVNACRCRTGSFKEGDLLVDTEGCKLIGMNPFDWEVRRFWRTPVPPTRCGYTLVKNVGDIDVSI
jgi:hypothetical protein